MNKQFSPVLLLILLFVSCTNQHLSKSENAGDITIDISNLEFGKYEDLIDSVSYIKLEVNDEYPISNIDKVAFHDSLLYVLDGKSKLLAYSRNGLFLFKIGEHGAGPNKYVEITDFSCNPVEQTIDLLDAGGRKILRFNLLTGEFIQKFPLKHFAYYGMTLGDNKYLFYDDSTQYFEIDLLKAEEPELLKQCTRNIAEQMVSADYLFKHSNGQIGLFCYQDNTIYYVDGNEVIPQYTISFNNYKTSADIVNEGNDNSEKAGIVVLSVKDLSDWIYVRYGMEENHRLYTFLYNKHSKKQYDFRGVINFGGILFVYPVAQESIDNLVILTNNNIPVTDYKSSLDQLSANNGGMMFRNIVENSTDDDNPLLQLVYLKKK